MKIDRVVGASLIVVLLFVSFPASASAFPEVDEVLVPAAMLEAAELSLELRMAMPMQRGCEREALFLLSAFAFFGAAELGVKVLCPWGGPYACAAAAAGPDAAQHRTGVAADDPVGAFARAEHLRAVDPGRYIDRGR